MLQSWKPYLQWECNSTGEKKQTNLRYQNYFGDQDLGISARWWKHTKSSERRTTAHETELLVSLHCVPKTR